MHVSTHIHTHKHMTAHIHTYRQTDTNTHTHVHDTNIHDTNIGRILAFVTCLGNTYVHMRIHEHKHVCKRSVSTDT